MSKAHSHITFRASIWRAAALVAIVATAVVTIAVPSASQSIQLDGRNELLPGGNVSIVATGCPVASDHQLTVVQVTPSDGRIEHLAAPMGDTYRFNVQSRFDTEPGEHLFVSYCQTLVGSQWSAITLYDTVEIVMLAEDPNVPPQTTRITGEFDTRTIAAQPAGSGGSVAPAVSFTG